MFTLLLIPNKNEFKSYYYFPNKQGGCVDSSSQALTCVLLALGEQNVSKVCTGPLSPYRYVEFSLFV